MKRYQTMAKSKKYQLIHAMSKKLITYGLAGIMGFTGVFPLPAYALTEKQIDNMKSVVRNSFLNDKGSTILEGGYQFGIHQWPYTLKPMEGYWANKEDFKPMKVDQPMNLGSISKLITAITTLKMVDKGTLSLTDKIGPWLKKHPSSEVQNIAFGSRVQDVTVYELLTQTSQFYAGDDWREALRKDRGIEGISSKGDEQIYQGSGKLNQRKAEPLDKFGHAIATGDFDGDSHQDLAIGVPGEVVSGTNEMSPGIVHIIYSKNDGSGLSNREIYFSQPDTKVRGGSFGKTLVSGDFNGDGVSDLAVGVPDGDVDLHIKAGAVYVFYGSKADGELSMSDYQILSQKGKTWKGGPESQDQFGFSLTKGDFDGDDIHDLVVGIPYEDIGNISNAGAVQVFYGSENKFNKRNQIWYLKDGKRDDFLGWSLAAGNFNGDYNGDYHWIHDLAIGMWGRDVNGQTDSGAVLVLFGSDRNGLTNTNSQVWSQDSPGIPGASEAWDSFGFSLAAGNFNGDGYSDLAIGVPYEDVNNNTVKNAGAVNILYGRKSGLAATTESSPSAVIMTEQGQKQEYDDRFGYSLASTDFNGDGYGDLAVGVPYENVSDITNAGTVNIFYGDRSGMAHYANRTKVFYQRNGNKLKTMQGKAEPHDRFGTVLVTGDFKRFIKGRDLIVGIPSEDVGEKSNAGAVHLLYGRGCSFNKVNIGQKTPCHWKYQNTNYKILRYVIEAAAKLKAGDPDEYPKALEKYVQDLWLNDITYNMSCHGNEDMLYYPDKVTLNIENGPSKSCSAGGWNGSAMDMLRLLRAIPFGILSKDMTSLLLSTTLPDRSGEAGSTALGWDPPDSAGGDIFLRKDGSLPHGIDTCLANFPDNVGMVLLVNDAGSPYTCNILKNAWKARND